MKRGETFLSEEIKELHWRPFQRDSGLSVWDLSGPISHTLSLRFGSLSCEHTKAGHVGGPGEGPWLIPSAAATPSTAGPSGREEPHSHFLSGVKRLKVISQRALKGPSQELLHNLPGQ